MSDLIRREDVIEVLMETIAPPTLTLNTLVMRINSLPSAETHDKRTETHGVCSDLIRREDAITIPVMPKERRQYQTMNIDDAYERGWYDLQDCIESLPSAEAVQGWIPVSEKPKDEERTYLVQLDSGGMRSCRWTNANPIWTELTIDWHWNIFDIPQYCNVVAWMDLEPYKGGDDE